MPTRRHIIRDNLVGSTRIVHVGELSEVGAQKIAPLEFVKHVHPHCGPGHGHIYIYKIRVNECRENSYSISTYQNICNYTMMKYHDALVSERHF